MSEFIAAHQYELELLAWLALAALLGGAVGFERELADKPAGLRTHMFVAVSSALVVGLGDVLITHFDRALDSSVLRADPIRVVEAVMAGIGFIGAGTIIRQGRDGVEGLTTAASLFFTGALGVCVAVHQVVLAVGATVSAIVVLRVIGALEHRHQRRRKGGEPQAS